MDLVHRLGMELPVVQAPMAGVQDERLAIAVNEAGGLGSLPCAMLAPDGMRDALRAIRLRTTRAVNVNFFCHAPPVPDPGREAAWRRLLAPYYAEFGIDPGTAVEGAQRKPFDRDACDAIEPFRPEVVSFHFGLPAPVLLARVRAWGAQVWSSATTLDEARWLDAHGVDVVIAQGIEAGGHRGHFLRDDLVGQPPTFELVAQIAAAVRKPVVAAGGIGDARGVATALRLGAAAVQCGTAYLLCREATTSAVHRAALRSDAVCETAVTNLFSGRPARGIVNRLMRELGAMRTDVPAFPLAAVALAPLRAREERSGRGGFSPLWAGQDAALPAAATAGEITRALARVDG